VQGGELGMGAGHLSPAVQVVQEMRQELLNSVRTVRIARPDRGRRAQNIRFADLLARAVVSEPWPPRLLDAVLTSQGLPRGQQPL